jgi:hypothetical protein
MQTIYPITEQSCKPYCGKPVIIMLHDETQIEGMLSRVEKGRIILNEPPVAATGTNKKGKSAQTRGSAKRGKAAKTAMEVNSTVPYGPLQSGPVLALDLSSVALLLVL